MDNERIILGLDIGIGSVGWGLVKLKEEKYTDETPDGTIAERYRITDGEIIGTGIRTFQPPQDDKGESLAVQRGKARRTRWTIRRKARRLKGLIELAKKFDLIGTTFNRDEVLIPKKGDKKERWDIWRFRKEALERKITDEEFFRVLYHIAKHRGAYFHTKAEFMTEEDKAQLKDKDPDKEKSKKETEDEKVKKWLRKNKKMLMESKYKTIGALFYETFKNGRKRNAPDKYEHSIHRELLRAEIIEIFKRQRELGNSKAKPEFEKRYIDDILIREKGIDENKLRKMMGECEFVPGARCAPSESYTAERFTLFNRLNTLKLVDTNKKDGLNDTQRGQIAELAYKNAKVTFAQIRDELGFQDRPHIRFNLCPYKEINPEYDEKLKCDVKDGKLQFDEEHNIPIIDTGTGEVKTLDREIKDIFQKRLRLKPNYKHIILSYSDIRKELQNSENFKISDFIFQKFEKKYIKTASKSGGEAEYIKQFEEDRDNPFVELKGYHKIRRAIEKADGKWEQIKKDTEKLDTIAEALTYCKSDKTRTAYLQQHNITDKEIIEAVLTINMKKVATYSKEASSNLIKHMEKGALFDEAKAKCGYGKKDYQKQAILEPYKGPFEKNPVVARVISQARKLTNAIMRKYNGQYPIDQIHIEIATDLANSEERKADIAKGQKRNKDEKDAARERCKEFNLDPEEGQNLLMVRLAGEQNNKCPYTGKAIMFSRTGATNEVYIEDCQIDHIIPMSRSFNDRMNNKVLCAPEANQNKRDRIPFEWFEETYGKDSQEWSDFENTVKKMYVLPYSKKKNLLRKSWTEEDKEKFLSRNLNDTRYAARHIADYLRKYFDFSISERDDIKEVSKVKVRSGGITAFLRYMWGLKKDRKESDLHHAIDALVVACSTDGHVYLVSNLAKEIERKGKSWFRHFDFIRGKFRPWANVREDIQNKVNSIFVSRMPRHKVTASAHDAEIWSLIEERRIKKAKKKNTKKKPDSMPMPTKRIVKTNGGYAQIGEMVRADVFADKDGKNYVVPIYATDFFRNKPLPDKYVPDDGELPYEEWPRVHDGNMSFKFSLFKDDLVGITNKDFNDEKFYVSFFEATTTNINVKNINGSEFPDKKDAKEPKKKKICYRPKRGKCVLKKYSVDMLGNYKEIVQEKRVGNKFENNSKKAL